MIEVPPRTTIISIQSQVVHGYVGNAAAVPAMQANGITVAAVPTTLLSNHPHYPTMRGRVLEAELVADLLRGVEERGLVERAAVLVTGYLGSTAIGEVVAAFVARARRRNPALVYLCDPVIGDDDLGVFVAPDLPALIAERLVPQAQIATPNRFELEKLAGVPIDSRAAAVAAARRLRLDGPTRVAITGCALADTPADALDTFSVDPATACRVTTPHLSVRLAGTGDLFAALLAARLALGAAFHDAVAAAVASTFAAVERSRASDDSELRLDMDPAEFVRPSRTFTAVRD